MIKFENILESLQDYLDDGTYEDLNDVSIEPADLGTKIYRGLNLELNEIDSVLPTWKTGKSKYFPRGIKSAWSKDRSVADNEYFTGVYDGESYSIILTYVIKKGDETMDLTKSTEYFNLKLTDFEVDAMHEQEVILLKPPVGLVDVFVYPME